MTETAHPELQKVGWMRQIERDYPHCLSVKRFRHPNVQTLEFWDWIDTEFRDDPARIHYGFGVLRFRDVSDAILTKLRWSLT